MSEDDLHFVAIQCEKNIRDFEKAASSSSSFCFTYHYQKRHILLQAEGLFEKKKEKGTGF